jgi:thiosulfate/3-mercaptopyruvate sulfurtransferase
MAIINAEEFVRALEKSDVIVIDARGGADAASQYRSAHVRGALRVDLETDLSDKKMNAADGGRHPLPAPKRFSELLSRLGITKNSHVIVYDDKSGANAAARFWWMMKAAGHSRISVVGATLETMRKAGVPFTSDEPLQPKPVSYPSLDWKLPTTTMPEVESASADVNQLIIDVRESYRYRGEREPIDLVAGHIPGATNVPYTENLDDNGNFHPVDHLRSKYQEIIRDFQPEHVIVHCGSGVTACHTLLAMDAAGITGAKLYVGSWSEWSRNGKGIATAEG